MVKANYLKFFLNTLFLVFTFCLIGSITVSASVMEETVDGMSGFSIIGDDKVWLDIKNENIFGKNYTEITSWAAANDWRLATHDEFIELLGALVPTYLYSSSTYNDSETGHFNENEAIIMGANDIPGAPAGEIQYFTAFIDEAYNERHIGVFEEEITGAPNMFHTYWGVDNHDNLGDIIYYGYESALLIKDVSVQDPIPEPATMLLFGIGLLGFAGLSRRKR
mgnify:CR=1 FL=1